VGLEVGAVVGIAVGVAGRVVVGVAVGPVVGDEDLERLALLSRNICRRRPVVHRLVHVAARLDENIKRGRLAPLSREVDSKGSLAPFSLAPFSSALFLRRILHLAKKEKKIWRSQKLLEIYPQIQTFLFGKRSKSA
jgi:hypothetical protein